jgi:hypothetical protein
MTLIAQYYLSTIIAPRLTLPSTALELLANYGQAH